ncbi:MAG: hypothetical protein V2B18_23650 [Pseudomonadota bacterium]
MDISTTNVPETQGTSPMDPDFSKVVAGIDALRDELRKGFADLIAAVSEPPEIRVVVNSDGSYDISEAGNYDLSG